MNERSLKSGASRRGLTALAAVLVLALGGCDSLLDVENPNNVQQADMEKPTAVVAAINGAFGTVTRGVLGMWGPYSTTTDEITWIGSRDAWQQLDHGFVQDPFNEFSDDAFKVLAEGRWMADEAIEIARPFYDAGTQAGVEWQYPFEKSDVARAYIYAAIAYTTIADQFDSFTLSDRTESAPAIPAEGMDQLYQTAVDYLGEAIIIAQDAGSAELATIARAIRARVHQSIEIWDVLNPAGAAATPAFVSSAAAAADAQAVLDAVEASWVFQLAPGTRNVAVPFEVALAYNVNQRQELQLGPAYVNISKEDKTELDAADPIALADPITGADDPILLARLDEFYVPNNVLVPYTVVSADEMHLILAENALAAGAAGAVEFQTHINAIRTRYGLPAWTPASGVSEEEIMMHERRVVLFLQGRRLSDMYRFGQKAPEWQPSSPAVTQPGTFFPITITEIRSNCHLNPDANC